MISNVINRLCICYRACVSCTQAVGSQVYRMFFGSLLGDDLIFSLLVLGVLCPEILANSEKYRCHVDDEAYSYDD